MDHDIKTLQPMAASRQQRPIPAFLKQEMPLLTAIAEALPLRSGDVATRLSVARKLLADAFRAIDRPKDLAHRDVA